jgi:Cu(I)/Ag(I) efflux system periplasmic protein CusF
MKLTPFTLPALGLACFVAFTASPTLTHAQSTTGAPTEQSNLPWTKAEIRKLDPENSKITLRHAEMKHLDMPTMTMVFSMQRKESYNGLQVGDKILIQAIFENGKYTVTSVKPDK